MAKRLTPPTEEEIHYYDYEVQEGEDLMPTTMTHEQEVGAVKSTLRQQFAGQLAGIYSELSFSQSIGGELRGVVPDVALVKGIAFDRDASSWSIPERGRGPQVVIEVGSATTWRIDVLKKPDIYPLFDVLEYFFVAPDPISLGPPFVRQYVPLLGWRWNFFLQKMEQLVPDEQGRLWSQELESWLVREDKHLHLYDRQGQRRLTETEAERLAKEVAQQRAATAEQQAEEEQQARKAAELKTRTERQARKVAEQRALAEQLARKVAEQRALAEQLARETAEQRAMTLVQKLRDLGINPDEL